MNIPVTVHWLISQYQQVTLIKELCPDELFFPLPLVKF